MTNKSRTALGPAAAALAVVAVCVYAAGLLSPVRPAAGEPSRVPTGLDYVSNIFYFAGLPFLTPGGWTHPLFAVGVVMTLAGRRAALPVALLALVNAAYLTSTVKLSWALPSLGPNPACLCWAAAAVLVTVAAGLGELSRWRRATDGIQC